MGRKYDVWIGREPQNESTHTIKYINMGGTTTLYQSNVYEADTPYVVNGTPHVSALTLPEPFKSERWGGPAFIGQFTDSPIITVNALPGRYHVRLLFCELAWDAPRTRIQDVFINDKLYLENFDIWSVASAQQNGGSGRGVPVIFNIVLDVVDKIVITFGVKADAASICGVETLDGTGKALSTVITPTVAPPAPTPGVGSRNPQLWPFSLIPWNRPATTAFIYEDASVGATADLLNGDARINGNNGYSHSAYIATDADPLAAWHDRRGYVEKFGGTVGSPQRFHLRADAYPAAGTDAHLHSIHRNAVIETWIADKLSHTEVHANRVSINDLLGPGILCYGCRAYDGSAIAGLIRLHELEEGRMDHAIAIGMDPFQMRTGPVWPAATDDYNYDGDYPGTGRVRMGMCFAIPRHINLAEVRFWENGQSHGFNREGMLLAQALQRFGAFVVDQAAPCVFYLEEWEPRTTHGDNRVYGLERKLYSATGAHDRYDQLYAIKNLMRQVVNSHNGNIEAFNRGAKREGNAWTGTPIYQQPPPLQPI